MRSHYFLKLPEVSLLKIQNACHIMPVPTFLCITYPRRTCPLLPYCWPILPCWWRADQGYWILFSLLQPLRRNCCRQSKWGILVSEWQISPTATTSLFFKYLIIWSRRASSKRVVWFGGLEWMHIMMMLDFPFPFYQNALYQPAMLQVMDLPIGICVFSV